VDDTEGRLRCLDSSNPCGCRDGQCSAAWTAMKRSTPPARRWAVYKVTPSYISPNTVRTEWPRAWFMFESEYGGCLDAGGGSDTAYRYNCDPTNKYQAFEYLPSERPDYFHLLSKATGKCVAANNNFSPRMENCSEGYGQQWSFDNGLLRNGYNDSAYLTARGSTDVSIASTYYSGRPPGGVGAYWNLKPSVA
jgi:hypothetical protein